ncbi:Siphovirus Gp157 [uncultured Caudovirales phage]|uniref:Siphovirus Gp157 n=1 Tax=uncultured Caudovirales phage TaxID=2100421 RepID=A0A6J5LB91_9CAUD|nr:Siphovirus Gp157 [uncultured Caudovirales phage]
MSTALTLYSLEENLVALLDTADMVEDPAQQEAILQEIVSAHLAAVEKRDRVGQFLAHCENQQAGIDTEIKRLQALKKAYVTTQERVEAYIVRTIQDIGKDDKGKFRKLEGKTTVLSIRPCPVSVEVKDEAAVPDRFKTLTITVPATAWSEFVDSADIEERAKFLVAVDRWDTAVSKKEVKAAIEAKQQVPGAILADTKYSLQRK